MKIESKTRLSLRKLIITMLAVGPLAVLPSPVWAVLPSASSYTVTNGTATLATSGTTVSISFTDKTILTWGVTTNATGRAAGGANIADGTTLTNFIVDSTDTWNFASTGSILNKVVAGNNTTNGSLGGAAAAAIINGQLLGNNAKVFILAPNGNIVIGNGAQISTQALVLSTLSGENDGTFITLGDLMNNAATSTGSISIGSVTAAGNITATAGSITTNGGTVSGDLVLKAITAGSAINLSTTASTTVAGNLSVTTNNGAITQSNNAVIVGTASGTQVATLTSGTASIDLGDQTKANSNSNDFERLVLSTSGSVNLRDANILTLGASSIGGDLTVKAGGRTNNVAIGTDGAVTITGNAILDSASSSNSGITLANGSSVGGYVTAVTAGGPVNLTTSGNLTLGNITNNVTATTMTGLPGVAGAAYAGLGATATTAGGVVTGLTLGAGTTSPIYRADLTATIASPIAAATAPALTGTGVTTGAATVTNVGSGYTLGAGATFPVTVVGGGGSGALATATLGVGALADTVVSVAITAAGTGYTTVPQIVISHPVTGAVAAEGTAVRDTTTGLVTSISITNAGVGYGASAPAVTFPAGNYVAGGITANATGALATSATAVGLTATAGVRTSQTLSFRGSTVTIGAGTPVNAAGNATHSFTSTAGDVAFGGTVTANRISVNASGGNITQTSVGIITTNNATTGSSFTATGNTITLDQANNISNNSPTAVTAANATIRSIQNITIGTTNVTTNLTVLADTGASATRNVTIGALDGSAATSATVGGILSITTNGAGWIRDNNDSRLDVFGGLNLQTGSPTAAGGDITLDAATFIGALTPSVRYGIVNARTTNPTATGAAATATASVTLAESTTLNLGNITASGLVASSATGGVIDTGVLTLGSSGASFTVSGNNNVVLDVNTNVIPVINLTGGVDNSITALNATTKLETTTNSTGTTTIATNTGAAIALGNVVQTGNVVLNSGSYIDIVGNANITGNLTLNATGNVPTVATLGNPYAPTVRVIDNITGRLDRVSVSNPSVLSFATAPTITINGGSLAPTVPAVVTGGVATLNAGAGNITGIPLAAGAGGASYTVAPTVTIGAPNLTAGTQATATATVVGGVITSFTITNAGSGYTAAPTVTLVGGGNPTTPATAVATLGLTGQFDPFSSTSTFNVTNSATNGGNVPYVVGYPIEVVITGTPTTAISQSAGTLKVSGTTSINSTAGNALFPRANDFNTVVLNNSTGGVLVSDVNNITVTGSTLGNLEVRSGQVAAVSTTTPFSEAGAWNAVLGNVAVGSLTVVAGNGTSVDGQNSGTITQQSGTTVYSYGNTSFTTRNATITLGNNGNNFGRIAVATNAGASINVTLVEDGTMKLGNISARGTTTLTSRFGGIIEDPAANVVISNNGTLSVNAANGSILIGNTTHTAGTTTANIVTFNASAPTGQVAVTSNNSTTLGTVNANSLSVEVTGGNGNIAQSGVATVFGTSNFSASNNITMTNNANNFGRIFLTTTGAASNIAITEGGTMNLGRVTMPALSTGTFTATSVGGDIVDTGLGGVKPGGTNVSPGTGIITLSAVAGNVLLDDPTTDFPSTGGVVFNSGNVTLSPLGGATLYLGAAGQTAVATGNLTVTSATGSIYNAGPVNVTGDAFFQSGSGDVLMTNASNNFSTVKFAGKIVSITEAGNLSLVTGSSATGAATFTTAGGSIDVVNRGGTISLASTGLFNASGNITLPKLVQVSDTLTVSAAGTKDLSKLSVSGDLGNKNPQNFGTGTYLPPLP